MGTGSVESLVLKWLRRLPAVPAPFSDACYFGCGHAALEEVR